MKMLKMERLPKKVLKRAKELTQKGIVLNCSESLLYFLNNKISLTSFNNETLDKFANLDYFDIISALKSWINNDDFILSNLSKMIINRDLLKIKLKSEKFSKADLESLQQTFSKENQISVQDSSYFIFKGKIKNQAYSVQAEPIRILKKDNTVEDVVEAVQGIHPDPPGRTLELVADAPVAEHLPRATTLKPHPPAVRVEQAVEDGSVPLDAGLRVKGEDLLRHQNVPPLTPEVKVPVVPDTAPVKVPVVPETGPVKVPFTPETLPENTPLVADTAPAIVRPVAWSKSL
jgi:hypothetical protein